MAVDRPEDWIVALVLKVGSREPSADGGDRTGLGITGDQMKPYQPMAPVVIPGDHPAVLLHFPLYMPCPVAPPVVDFYLWTPANSVSLSG